MRQTQILDKNKKKIEMLIADGLTQNDISIAIGVAPDILCRWIRSRSIFYPNARNYPHKLDRYHGKIRRMIEQGMTQTSIANSLVVPQPCISYWLNSRGLNIPANVNFRKLAQNYEQVEQLVLDGISTSEIAKIMNVTYQAVYYWTKRNIAKSNE